MEKGTSSYRENLMTSDRSDVMHVIGWERGRK